MCIDISIDIGTNTDIDIIRCVCIYKHTHIVAHDGDAH